MDTTFEQNSEITRHILNNKQNFEKKLLSEAVNVAGKIHDILREGNIDLLKNAQKLVVYILEKQEDKLAEFAKQEGISWAKNSLTLSFKLEWVQAIRRTLWHFLYEYDKKRKHVDQLDQFYKQERDINDMVDKFLNDFFLNYSSYKDDLIKSQRKLVEHLSVPIIPVSSSIAVLPLIGMVDEYRIKTIEEKVLTDVARLKIQTLIMGLSGIADMEMDIIDHLQKVLSGIAMMGSKAVITGLRPDLVRKMVHTGISFTNKAETRGTLQQTLRQYLELEPKA
ncbi:STAS domain-containing protein [Bacillus sp. FJAT-27251]|uniref:STAS domain-containing protein n=1 Tax=Bacillus sp. FJAT-27251 TaxID=1684142 RepID=UPI0006A774E3|nr:STAS domain-containing protein [Bacillus sp. FJAT-27251]